MHVPVIRVRIYTRNSNEDKQYTNASQFSSSFFAMSLLTPFNLFVEIKWTQTNNIYQYSLSEFVTYPDLTLRNIGRKSWQDTDPSSTCCVQTFHRSSVFHLGRVNSKTTLESFEVSTMQGNIIKHIHIISNLYTITDFLMHLIKRVYEQIVK